MQYSALDLCPAPRFAKASGVQRPTCEKSVYENRALSLDAPPCFLLFVGVSSSSGGSSGAPCPAANVLGQTHVIKCHECGPEGHMRKTRQGKLYALSFQISRPSDLGLVGFLPPGEEIQNFIFHIHPCGAVAKSTYSGCYVQLISPQGWSSPTHP